MKTYESKKHLHRTCVTNKIGWKERHLLVSRAEDYPDGTVTWTGFPLRANSFSKLAAYSVIVVSAKGLWAQVMWFYIGGVLQMIWCWWCFEDDLMLVVFWTWFDVGGVWNSFTSQLSSLRLKYVFLCKIILIVGGNDTYRLSKKETEQRSRHQLSWWHTGKVLCCLCKGSIGGPGRGSNETFLNSKAYHAR